MQREAASATKKEGLGIFDKIYKFLNRETKEEKEERERLELERERRLLFGPAARSYNNFVPGSIQLDNN